MSLNEMVKCIVDAIIAFKNKRLKILNIIMHV